MGPRRSKAGGTIDEMVPPTSKQASKQTSIDIECNDSV